MNEQFVILADKLNNVVTLAETLTPEIIEQTLNFTTLVNTVFTVVFLIVTLICITKSYKLYKSDSFNIESSLFITALAGILLLFSVCSLVEVVYYPYSWAYSHFVK